MKVVKVHGESEDREWNLGSSHSNKKGALVRRKDKRRNQRNGKVESVQIASEKVFTLS